MGKDYNYFYSKNDFYFGKDPSPELVEVVEKYNIKSCRVADIGAGEGRDSLYLARLGFDVIAIEPNYYGYKKIQRMASEEKLKITPIHSDLFNGLNQITSVDFIILETVLNEFARDSFSEIVSKVHSKLRKNGYVYVSVFTKSDPGFIDATSDNASECTSSLKYHFDKNELKMIFSDLFDTIEYKEFMYDDFSHGQPHKHATAVIFAKKK